MTTNQKISVGQLSASGSANGQVLASNGTSVYWLTGGTGYNGSVGFTGSTGSTGFTGSVGYTGSVGSAGYTGSLGYSGSVGFTGSIGSLGYTGSKGATGDFGGAAFNYVFSTNTTHTSTPNGYFNFNNTSFTSATSLYLDYIDNLGANSYSFLQTIDDSTSSIKGHFSVRDTANSLNYAMFAITGSHTEDVDHFDVPVSYLSGVTSFTNGTNTVITFARTGNIGDTGYTGSIGYTGSGFANGQSISVNNLAVTGTLTVNSSVGTAGQILASNGTGLYWTNDQVSNNITTVVLTTNTLNSDYINIGVGFLTVGNSTVNTTVTNSGIRVSNTTSNVVLTLTDFRVPVGNTAQRPANAAVGFIRFNTDNTDLEYAANSTKWYSITTQETLTSNNINITSLVSIGNSTVNTVITSSSIKTTTANVNVINSTGNVFITGNTAIFKVPVGTTAQRPSPADTGYIRFNTTTTDLEYAANSSTWYSITTQETLTTNNISVNNNITVGNSTTNSVITSTYIRTPNLNVISVYANSSYGTAGQVLTTNGTGVYWSTSVGYTGSAGTNGTNGATGYTGSAGTNGATGYTGSAGSGGGGGGASVTVSATAPVSPTAGDLWWSSENGTLYIYYNDGDTSQWVSSSSQGPSGYTGSSGGISTGKSIAMSMIFGG